VRAAYAAVYRYALMLRCWDSEPTERPLFCELSSSVALIIAKMTAAAAAAETAGEWTCRAESPADTDSHSAASVNGGGLPPAAGGYVNAPAATDYLRPLATAQSNDSHRPLDTAAAAAASETQSDDDDVGELNSDVEHSDSYNCSGVL